MRMAGKVKHMHYALPDWLAVVALINRDGLDKNCRATVLAFDGPLQVSNVDFSVHAGSLRA